MKALLTGVAAALLAATPAATYQIDLARYFPSAAAEAQSRATVVAEATAFASSATPTTASGLLRWLQRYDGLLARIERHDIYVYLKAEEDDRDNADAKADDALGNAEDLVSNRVVGGGAAAGRSAHCRADARPIACALPVSAAPGARAVRAPPRLPPRRGALRSR